MHTSIYIKVINDRSGGCEARKLTFTEPSIKVVLTMVLHQSNRPRFTSLYIRKASIL